MITTKLTSHHVPGKANNNRVVAHIPNDNGVGPCASYTVSPEGGDAVPLEFATMDVAGLHNEDLIAIIIDRIERFQSTDFRCRENACAITKLQEAQMWLSRRTLQRVVRGVENTTTV